MDGVDSTTSLDDSLYYPSAALHVGSLDDDNLPGFNVMGIFDHVIPDWVIAERTSERDEIPVQML